MRVLITNDDGISSPGLVVLAHVAADAGHDVIVAAPNREYSGWSAGLSGDQEHGQLRRSEARPPGLRDEIAAVAVHASPALIAYAAGLGAFGPRPDLLLSGVNLGPNVGPAVVHSGTVGAALSAAAQGIPAMAASITTGAPEHWDTATLVLARAFDWLTSHPQDDRVLNVNVPDVPVAELKGLRTAPLAKFDIDVNLVNEQVESLLFHPYTESRIEFPPGTDAAFLGQGWATVSLLRSHSHDEADASLPSLSMEEISG